MNKISLEYWSRSISRIPTILSICILAVGIVITKYYCTHRSINGSSVWTNMLLKANVTAKVYNHHYAV